MKLSEWIFLPLRLVDQGLGVISGYGSWWLRDHEKQLIDIVRANLSPANQAILDQQLKMWFFADRRGKSTGMFHLFQSKVPPMHLSQETGTQFTDDIWLHNLGNIYVESPGGKCKVSVEAKNGCLMFLEFSVSPKNIFKHPFKVLKTEFGEPVDMSAAKEEYDEEHVWTMPYDEYMKQMKEHQKSDSR